MEDAHTDELVRGTQAGVLQQTGGTYYAVETRGISGTCVADGGRTESRNPGIPESRKYLAEGSQYGSGGECDDDDGYHRSRNGSDDIGDWKLEIGNWFLFSGSLVADSCACFCTAALAPLGNGVA